MYRSLDRYFSDWKASELTYFLLFYSPVVLKKYLPLKYYKHWLLLVNFMRRLAKQTISNRDLQVCRILAVRFTRSIPKLYGKKYVRYNVHLLPHIVNVCIQCSCFSETVCDRGNVWDSSGKTMFLEKELKCSISLPVYDNPANHPYCIDVVFDVV